MALIRILLLLLICCTPADGAIRFRKLLLRGNPIPYSPLDIPNLFGWWKADALTNLVNGSEVASWPDSSGHNLTMVPPSVGGGVSPYWTNNFQNSKPSAYFDGVNDYMTNMCTMVQTNLVFIVLSSMIPIGSSSYVFDGNNDFDNTSEWFAWQNSQMILATAHAGPGGAFEAPGPNTNIVTTWTIQFAGDYGAVWTNGVLSATNYVGTLGMVGGMTVGVRQSHTSQHFKGYLLELFCVTNSFATPDLLQNATEYLRIKYAHH